MAATSLGRLVRPGWDAVRANARAIILIQCVAIVFLMAYTFLPSVRGAATGLGPVRDQIGLAFPFLANVLSGVVLPQVAKLVTGLPGFRGKRDALFQFVFFGLMGLLIDVFYRQQAVIFGDRSDIGTIATKVIVDQFVFTPLVSIPLSVVLFAWRDANFDFGRVKRALRPELFPRRYLTILVSCWAFWIPSVSIIYAFPAELQFWIFLFAAAAWSLLLVTMTTTRAESTG